jgi:hypothetical protein
MKNRRSFLKMLGLGAVAAPVAAKLAVEAMPVMPAPPTAEYLSGRQIMLMQHRGVLELQRELNRLHSRALATLNTQLAYDDPESYLRQMRARYG